VKRWLERGNGLALAVFGVALAIRVVYLLDIRGNPFFDSPVIDAQYYRDLGAALARGEGTGRAPFMMPPLYPLVLAGLRWGAGPGPWPAHVLQILLGAATAALAAVIGRRLGGRAVGWLAGMAVATSRALLFVEGDFLATPLAVCLDLLFLYWLLRYLQSARRRDLVASGVACGLGALAVPTVLASLVVLALWLCWRRRRADAAILCVAALLPILPITAYNLRASDSWVWISANGGINFYIGNNANMQHTAALRPGPEWRRMNDLPLREAGIVYPAGRDRWFYAQGLRFWREEPLRALAHTGEKLVQLLQSRELMRDFDFYFFAGHYSRLLRLPGWSFAWLLGFAALGTWRARRGGAGETAALLWLSSYALAIVAFFVTARYRAPLLPILAVFAGMGIVWCVDAARRRGWPALASGLAVAATIGSLSSITWFGAKDTDAAEALYRVGTAYQQQGDCARAMQQFDAVLRLQPQHALAMAHAAQCEHSQGQLQAAVDRYEILVRMHPDYVEPMVNLANIAWAGGDSVSAAHYYALAIATDAYFAPAHAYYGLFLLSHQAAQPALARLERALALDPGWETLRVDLARACVAAGRAERALRELDTVLEVMPATDAVELVRGDALQRLGRTLEARAAWERGLHLNPAHAELQQRLRNAS